MDVSELKQIKDFIEQCKSNPSILEHPELSFFRDYIGGLRRKITSSGGDYKESHLVGEKIYDIIEDTPPHEEDEPNVVELDIDLDDRGIVDPDNDPPQKMGDLSVDVSEENRDASQVAKNRAMEAISEGKLEVAIEHLTTAILLNPTSAIMYGTRASVYIKMKKPNAAIRDATAALEINPDSAKEYKSRGIARAMLGQWEEAAKDLHMASKIDYGEEISSLLKKVDINAHKIEEHRRKYDRLRKERVDKKIEYECQPSGTEPQAGFKRKKNEQSSSNRLDGMPGAGFPGGMPGGIPMFGGFPGACFPRGLHRGFPNGMPGGYPGGGFPGGIPEGYITEYCQVFSDPELSAAFQDPRIFSKLRDLVLNPDNLVKHESDPKLAPILAKLKNICFRVWARSPVTLFA